MLFKRVIKYGLGLSSNGLGQLVFFGYEILIARFLGVSDYGIYALTVAIVMFIVEVCYLGISSITPRMIAENMGKEQSFFIAPIAKKSLYILFFVSVLIVLTSQASLYFFRDLYSDTILLDTLSVFFLFVPFIYLQKISLAWLKGVGLNQLQIFLNSVVHNSLIFILCVTAWFKFEDLRYVVFFYGLSYVFLGSATYLFSVRVIRAYGRDRSYKLSSFDMIKEGFPLSIAALGGRFFRRGDLFIVGILLGESSVGIYRSAYVLVSGVKQLISPISEFALYALSVKKGQDDMKGVFHHYNLAVILGLIISIPIYSFLYLNAAEVLNSTFGVDFSQGEIVLKILVFAFIIFTCCGQVGTIFNVLGKNWIRMYLMLALGVANMALNYVAITLFGYEGVAYGTFISFLMMYCLVQWILVQSADYYEFDFFHLAYVAVTILFLLIIDAYVEGNVELLVSSFILSFFLLLIGCVCLKKRLY